MFFMSKSKLSLPNCAMCYSNKYTKIKIITSDSYNRKGEKTIPGKFIFYCALHSIAYVDVRKEAKEATTLDYDINRQSF